MTLNNDAVRELIAESCLALNAEDYDRFLSLCDEEFQYQVVTYSPEIRSEMVWTKQDLNGLRSLFADLPTHIHIPTGSLFRHVSLYSVKPGEVSFQVEALSSVLVILTDLDGRSNLFAAAYYEDTVVLSGDRPLLRSRTTRLETRDIGVGTAIPL